MQMRIVTYKHFVFFVIFWTSLIFPSLCSCAHVSPEDSWEHTQEGSLRTLFAVSAEEKKEVHKAFPGVQTEEALAGNQKSFRTLMEQVRDIRDASASEILRSVLARCLAASSYEKVRRSEEFTSSDGLIQNQEFTPPERKQCSDGIKQNYLKGYPPFKEALGYLNECSLSKEQELLMAHWYVPPPIEPPSD